MVDNAVTLEIRVLGELSVRVRGVEQPLPRSRKTRALLAYLALTGREHRRERLCELFWDVTDDPRAALRWSLSKLRALLTDAAPQLVATRERVALRLDADAVDLPRLRRIVRHELDETATETLEELANSCRGELLEGMLLPDFDAFEAWLEAERAEARALESRLRRCLVERLTEAPERAIVHARAWSRVTGDADAQRHVERLSAKLAREVSPPAPVSVPRPPRALVGRDREIERLQRIMRATREHRRAHTVLIVGEPGIGKTRLLEELVLREGDVALLSGAFYEVERGRPLAPFVDVVRSGSIDEAPDREQLFESIAGLVRRGAEERGLVLLSLDDAHLADPSSSELLHYLVRTATRLPLVTAIACRPAELDDNPDLTRALAALRRHQAIEEIHLGALDEAATRALVGAHADGDALERVVRDSAGIPLVALEMARAAQAGEIPRTFADVVMARLGTLTHAAQALVRWTAVLTHGPLELLERVCANEVADFVAALELAERYRFVRVDASGGVRVEHALVGRIVYERISELRRAAMHRTAADHLSACHAVPDHSAAVAHHASLADRPALAAQALIRSAERSLALGALREAIDLGDRALALVDRLDGVTAVSVEVQARTLLLQVRRPEEPEVWTERLTALGLEALALGEAALASRAFQAAGGLRWETGDGPAVVRSTRQTLSASSAAALPDRVRGRSMAALCLALIEKELADAHALVLEAEALARTDGAAVEPAELALARGHLHLHAGRIDDARRDAADARMLARMERRTVREALALQLTMQIELLAGRNDAVVDAAHELEAIAARIREGPEASLAAAGKTLTSSSIDEVRTALAPVIERLRILDDKRALAWVQNRWAARELRHGDPQLAAQLAASALVAARAVEAQSEAAIAACHAMAAAAALGDDAGYAAAEDALAAIEDESTLSHEARRLILTTTHQPAAVEESA